MPVSIALRGPASGGPVAQHAVRAVYDELHDVEATFSTYRRESEVSRLRAGDLPLAAAGAELREVAALCDEARRRTDGAFDPFLPDRDGVRRFDPTGLVKGWAAERAARHLAALDGHAYCLNAGGDVIVGGCDPADDAPWRIGVEHPDRPAELAAVLGLVEGAVATSGTAHRGAHIVDPATGLAASAVRSVTVVGPSLLWADVLATAAFVRGADALALVSREPGYGAIVVERDGTIRSALEADVAPAR